MRSIGSATKVPQNELLGAANTSEQLKIWFCREKAQKSQEVFVPSALFGGQTGCW